MSETISTEDIISKLTDDEFTKIVPVDFPSHTDMLDMYSKYPPGSRIPVSSLPKTLTTSTSTFIHPAYIVSTATNLPVQELKAFLELLDAINSAREMLNIVGPGEHGQYADVLVKLYDSLASFVNTEAYKKLKEYTNGK